mgnify:FL=1
MEAAFSLKEVQAIVGRPATSLQYLIDQALPPHGVKGRKRLFSVAEAVVLLVAQKLFDHGFKAHHACVLAKACGEYFHSLLLDDDANFWLFAAPKDNGFSFTVTNDAAEGLTILEALPNCHIINVRRTLQAAMALLLAAHQEDLHA